MNSISILKNFTAPISEKPLDLILTEIRTGYYKDTIESLYKFYLQDKLGHYENGKREQLLTFTASGVFQSYNNLLTLSKYSQYIILDTGRIHPLDVIHSCRKLKKDPHTLAFFKSPSRTSVKILVEVNTAWAYHQEAFHQAKEYFSKLLKLPIVNSARDFTQLCFYSSDPHLFQNPNHKIFQVQIPIF